LEDNSLEHNLNLFWEVEPVVQTTTTTEQQVCEKHFITHTTKQKYGRFVFRLPTNLDHKQIGSTRFSAERRLQDISTKILA